MTLIAVCILTYLYLYFFSMMWSSVVNVFALFGRFALLIAIAVLLLWPLLRRMVKHMKARRWGKISLGFISAVLAGSIILFGVISVSMLTAMDAVSDGQGETLIVLGAKVNPSGNPSLMLKNRMDMSIEYLREHTDVPCIVTGGQGPNEPMGESAVMKAYLLDHGIAEERIFEEDKATSTYENIKFSKEIIEQNGFSKEVVIATDEFHQYRAQLFARNAGLSPSAQTSRTPSFLLSGYWIREMGAIMKAYVTGR